MKYLLFVGSRVGYEALRIFIESNCILAHVFIEKEHSHEHVKYYEESIKLCESNNVSYNLNATSTIINGLIDNEITFDYIISFGYRKMIADNVINAAKIAALGTHFSPLPRYRGFAPLNWLLINGEKMTAVNLFYLGSEVDSGDIIEKMQVNIDDNDDINDLMENCVITLKKLLIKVIPSLEDHSFVAQKQDNTKATFTCARNPEDGIIKWEKDSTSVYNLVRALTYPYPGAFTYYNGKRIAIWSCEVYDIPVYEGVVPGKVIKIIRGKGVVVLCSQGAVLIRKIQVENENSVIADDVIKSIRATLG